LDAIGGRRGDDALPRFTLSTNSLEEEEEEEEKEDGTMEVAAVEVTKISEV